MLTTKQRELLKFIEERVKANGVSPSFDEMRDAVQLKSKSGIHRLIVGLEERGFIRRLPHRARALEVCRSLESITEKPRKTVAPPTPANLDIPLYGRIAAGTPIEAWQDNSRQVSVPASMLNKGDHYALEVAGDSMQDAGILDGDTVIIRKCETAENGSIVVALLVDDNEATLKRFFKRGHNVALEPANTAYETRIFGPDLVKVQGQLVGLLRKY